MSLTNICWYLRTVHKCFMEQFFVLAMFISLYGTAPRRGLKEKQRVFKSPYYRGVQLWKTIPVDVQMSARKTDFKRGIKHVLLKYDL